MKISDTLYKAADLVWHGDPKLAPLATVQTSYNRNIPVHHCCWAVTMALGLSWRGESSTNLPAINFLRGLGMPYHAAFADMEFSHGASTWEIQQTRHAFLWFAAQVAEEEGL